MTLAHSFHAPPFIYRGVWAGPTNLRYAMQRRSGFSYVYYEKQAISSNNSPSCVTYLNWEFAKNAVFFLFFLRLAEWEPDLCASKSVRREIPLLKNEGVCDPRIFAHRRILCTRGGITQNAMFGPKKSVHTWRNLKIERARFFVLQTPRGE